MHQLGEFDIGDATVFLQFLQDTNVDPVELHVRPSLLPTTRLADAAANNNIILV